MIGETKGKKKMKGNWTANIVCVLLAGILFVRLSMTSYKEDAPFDILNHPLIQEYERRIAELEKKDQNNLTGEKIISLPHPSRKIAQIPVVEHFDNYSCMTGMVEWRESIKTIEIDEDTLVGAITLYD
jgi:hypothetical protein